MERDSWATVIGSDSPVCAIYSDGIIVYRTQANSPDQTNPFLTRTVVDAKQTIRELLSFEIENMQGDHALSSATDQVATEIWTPAKAIRIYGDWRKPPDLSWVRGPEMKGVAEREKQMWKSLPEKIRQALMRVDEVRKAKGTTWLPAKVEVMFWPYENALDPPLLWPADWPGLNDKETRKRGSDSYSVYLLSEKFAALRELMSRGKGTRAVLITNKKMACDYRFPFPGEEAWMK